MLNAKAIKNHLTIQDIIKLMKRLKVHPQATKEDIIQTRTVCHDGTSHKLYYYHNNRIFHCYTNCGSFDIFELIQKIYNYNFKQAFQWIKSFYGLSESVKVSQISSNDTDTTEKYTKQNQNPKLTQLKTYDPRILNSYDKIAYIDWIREDITPKTLNKFHIRLDIPDEQIIIPEYDYNGRLIGVRSRHLDKEFLRSGRKYTPLNHKGHVLNYPIQQILYGLNFNKSAINYYHKMILFEAEKSVMKMDSYLDNKNIAVGLCGSNLTSTQINLIQMLNINEVIVALDKEFKHPFTRAERIYAEKIKSEFARLNSFCQVSVVWDVDDSLNYKDSPIDKGLKTFKHLMKHRIFLY